MGNNDIPKDLPKCEFIRVLAEKVNQRVDIDFHVLGRLEEFRQKVSGEVRQINELFPEYTPHDEQYHLKRLFYVADIVLGKDRIEAMNVGELFVLAVALYGHDWGMAVNEVEKNYIINNAIPNDKSPESLWIMPDEKNRFESFARDQQLQVKDNKFNEIPIEKWREYVRRTHAFRSGSRIRKFFEPIDGGVADAAARVCIGHWLNFEDLQDHDSYPVNYSAMRDEVNLRALAIYLRLIDLLDLAGDRTPYVIWKFVAPRDSRSKMEWDKHRALNAVTCPRYQEGRVIRVDGSTDSHEVYASLEDLRIWCETQFRGSNDVLARMNDPRHKLDLYHIDWHVEARGFKKTSIGFQFDRERMFEILGNEIYQGDPYVFLRELLQNSIDAIRMRREILRKYAKYDPANLGVIKVTVNHLDDGDAIITWSDDGIGMDEYIVQNYLAIAGKSYYRSQDFEKVGLEMDPISRFGIGILSCFIVADSIEIETYKDPNLFPRSNPLKIVIPDQSKRFRIEELSEGFAKIGTTVKVFVRNKKFSKYNDSKMKFLDVTRYLSIIAGFVEFPIIIDENGNKTIILHPKQNTEYIIQSFGKEYKLHKLDLKYPWSMAILPQDLSVAQGLLREECFDLASDLGMKDYEGILAHLIPSDEWVDFDDIGRIANNKHKKYKNKVLRCERSWRSYATPEYEELSRSAKVSQSCSVFRDGILIPNVDEPHFKKIRIYDALPKMRIVANLSKKRTPILDLARTNFREQNNHWYDTINKEYTKKICNANLERLLALDPLKRLFQMGRIIVFNNIDPSELWEVFPHAHWPVAFMQSQGKIMVEEYKNISKSPLYEFPNPLNKRKLYDLLQLKIDRGFLKKWRGNNVLIDGFGPSQSFSLGLRGAAMVSNEAVKQSYYEAYAQFIRPPWEGNPPLIQGVLVREENSKEPIGKEVLFERGFEDPKSLDSYELFILNKAINKKMTTHGAIKFINFSKPFDDLFAYGSKIINIKHPSGQDLLRFICCINSEKIGATKSRDLVGKLDDLLMNFINSYLPLDSKIIENGYLLEEENVNHKLREIWRAAKEAKIFRLVEAEETIPGMDDFVPGTIICSYDAIQKSEIRNFGDMIETATKIK